MRRRNLVINRSQLACEPGSGSAQGVERFDLDGGVASSVQQVDDKAEEHENHSQVEREPACDSVQGVAHFEQRSRLVAQLVVKRAAVNSGCLWMLLADLKFESEVPSSVRLVNDEAQEHANPPDDARRVA